MTFLRGRQPIGVWTAVAGGMLDMDDYVTPFAMAAGLRHPATHYARLSPAERAARVDTAVMFLVAQDDQCCPVGQCEAMYANVVRAVNERSMTVIYPAGSHSLARSGAPSHRVDYHDRVVKWIEAHVRD